MIDGTPASGSIRVDSVDSRRTLSRSIRLLRAFRVEQTDPERFYSLLAADSLAILRQHGDVAGRTLLDVGAGRPQFSRAFAAAGCRYVAVDLDVSALQGTERAGYALCARGEQLPLRSASVDITFSSNVVEHLSDPWAMCDELVRVTQPGGLVFISYTNWLSPWGGHETSPFHLVSGRWAVARYTRHYGRPPKNRVAENLFPVSVAAGLEWARTQTVATLLEACPRYYPRWANGVVRVPGLREVGTWNLLLLLRRL